MCCNHFHRIPRNYCPTELLKLADFYKTIVKTGESLYKEKGSKFLGLALGIENESELKNNIDDLRRKHHNARHVCWGMILGQNGEIKKSNDDGEPAFSAGEPILGQMIASDITFAAVLVVRYFGGTKLGVGGLKQAYKQAAYDAIANAKIEKNYPSFKLRITFPYEHTQIIMNLVDQHGVIVDQDYGDHIIALVAIREMYRKEVLSKLDSVEYLTISYKEISK